MIDFGVVREVWKFDVNGVDEAVIHTTGSLIVYDDGEISAPIAEVTVYSMSTDRLRDVLQAAAEGEPVDDILVALEAAALASDQYRAPDDDADPAA